ncbi:MAG: hypothetical protein QXM96_04335 [Candidatus Woesearchaeota archaeon]
MKILNFLFFLFVTFFYSQNYLIKGKDTLLCYSVQEINSINLKLLSLKYCEENFNLCEKKINYKDSLIMEQDMFIKNMNSYLIKLEFDFLEQKNKNKDLEKKLKKKNKTIFGLTFFIGTSVFLNYFLISKNK